jgi:hypothetical protein
MAAGYGNATKILVKVPSPPKGGGSASGGVFTPRGFVPNAAPTPPNQAPYKPGHSPAQVKTAQKKVTVRRNAGPMVPAPAPAGTTVPSVQQVLGHTPKQIAAAAHEQAAREHLAAITQTASIQPVPKTFSTAQRTTPHFKSEPIAGYIRATSQTPGARYTSRGFIAPYYTDAHTHTSTRGQVGALNDTSQFEAQFGAQTEANLEHANRIVNPVAGAVISSAAGALPGVGIATAIRDGHFNAGAVQSEALNDAAWLGPKEIMAPLQIGRDAVKAARGGDDIVQAFKVARDVRATGIQADAADKATLGALRNTVSRSKYVETLQKAGFSPKSVKAQANVADQVAHAYMAMHPEVTPEEAWQRVYLHSQFNDVAITKNDIETGKVVFAQEGKQPEVNNLAGTPAEHTAPPNAEVDLKRVAANMMRAHRAALPPEFNTPTKLHALLIELRERALEASAYRKWYEQSSTAIMQHVHGDTAEADKLAALIAIYSPRAEVYSKSSEWNNLDRALNAYNDFKATGEISPKWSISSHKTGEADWQTHRAQQVMAGNFEWQGLKTNRFYRNFLQHIDPAKYYAEFGTEKFGTMDTWMRRAFRYPKKYTTETEHTLFGTVEKNVGKAQEPITDPMYRFMEKANAAVGASLGWSPEEVQAAIWTSIKSEQEGTPLSQAGFDFSHAFEHREAKIAAPIKPEQLTMDTTATDKPIVSDVQAAIDASREPDSGFTLTPLLRPDNGKGQYIVAYGAYETREKAPLTAQTLLDFRNAHLDLLKSDPSLRIGGWHNPSDGHVYLDISRAFDSHDEAMQFAREQGQLSIYDRQNPDGSLPTGLTEKQADTIKAGHQEVARLQGQAGKYDSLLAQAHKMMGGKVPKSGVLTKADRKATEDMLFDYANKLSPEERHSFETLVYESGLARNAPDPEILFQDDPLVQSIADAHGMEINKEAVAKKYEGKNLDGLPKSRSSNKTAQGIARDYMKDSGIPYHPPTDYAKVNPDRAERIAQWYEDATSAPNDPAVRASYEAMAKETKAQYDAIVKAGYRFEFYPKEDPYPSGPSAAIDDLRSNQHLYVFPTDEGFGTISKAEDAHPLLGDSGVKWGDKTVTHNDLFRAVHDFMGHFKEGVGFRADGEENAWRAHSAMYSDEARPAMTAETRGQNSWVNYGPHAEANKTADQAATVYADQKAVIAPDWIVNDGAKAPSPQIKGAVARLPGGEHILHLFRGADASTAIHELGHAIETMLPKDTREAFAAAGLTDEESFARSFERYFHDGQAPTPELAGPMRQVMADMADIYKSGEAIPGSKMNPEIRQMFDKFFQREGATDPRFAATAGAKWFAQDDQNPPDYFGEEQPFSDETLANTHQPVPDLTPAEQVQKGFAGARSQYGLQKVQRSKDSSRRARAVDEALRTIEDPDEAMYAAKMAMRGEMPKIELNGIMRDMDAGTLRELKSMVNHRDDLMPFQKVNLNDALDQAVNEGRIPAPHEMRLIEHVFGKKNAGAMVAIAGNSKWDVFINVMNIPRTLQSTADLSAIGRQSFVAGVSHPIIWGKNFPVAVRGFKSSDFYEKTEEAIKNDPLYTLALAARVSFTDMGEGATSLAHEEAFGSDYATKIPALGSVIKGSARSYVGFLNKMRMDLFRHQIRIALKAGRDVHDEHFLKSIGDVINASTGRGTIHGRAEHILPALNTLLYSPRLMLSRLNYLDPTWYYRLDKQARLEALRGLFAATGAVSTIVYMASQIPGVHVGSLDPRNADFGKIKIGNTRLDIAGGFLQYTRLAAVLASNTAISSTTGVKTKLGSGFGVPTRWDEIQNFAYNKLAPVPAMVHEVVKGKDAVGNPVTPQSLAVQDFTPLIAQDAKDLYNEHGGGGNGIAWALGGYGIGAIGVGEQTYGPKDPAKKPTQKIEQEAKDAGFPPPSKDMLIHVGRKAELDSITQQHKGDLPGRLDAVLKYYAKTTGDHQWDHLIGNNLSDVNAEAAVHYLRAALIGTGLSRYEAALKKAEASHAGK